MDRHTIIVVIAVLLTVTLPYWVGMAMLVSWAPAQAILAVLQYGLEILLMIALMMAVIEGRLRLLIGAAAVSLVFGAVPITAVLPMALFLPLWLKALIPAMVMGMMVNHGHRAWKSFMIAFALMAIFVLMLYARTAPELLGSADHLRTSIEKTVSGPMATSGYNTETINALVDQLYLLLKLAIHLLPSMLIMSAGSQLFLAFLLTVWYYTRRDSYFPGFGPYTYWKIPEKVLYLLGVLILVRLLFGGSVRMAADNVLFIMLFGFAVTGLSVIEYFLRRLSLPVLVRVVFYIGLTFMHIFGLLATSLAGLFDSYFDFRKVRAHTLG